MAIELEGQLPKNADAKTFKEGYTILFGKYKGKKVEELLTEDPSWIIWAQKNVAFLQFTDSVLVKAQKAIAGTPKLSFTFNELELQDAVDRLQEMSRGLDTYGENGVRQLHGIGNQVDLHRTLGILKQMTLFILQEKEAGRSISFEETKA